MTRSPLTLLVSLLTATMSATLSLVELMKPKSPMTAPIVFGPAAQWDFTTKLPGVTAELFSRTLTECPVWFEVTISGKPPPLISPIVRETGIRPTVYGLPEAPVKVGVAPVLVFNSTMTRLLKLSLTAKSVLLSWLKLPAAIAEGTVVFGKVIGKGAPNVAFQVHVRWPARQFTVQPASPPAT